MGKVDSSTRCFGLIGYPLKHSFSPQIHEIIFNHLSLNAVYLCFEVKSSFVGAALKGCSALGIKGLNVTIPYKEKVIPYLHTLSKEASVIGAVNTIRIRENGRLEGFNTDGEGFLLSLRRHNINPRGKSVLIIGAGGAARAVSVYLARERVRRIAIYDIVSSRAQSLVKHLKKFYPHIDTGWVKDKRTFAIKDVDLLINASGVGLKKGDPVVFPLKGAKKTLVVYDLIYNPLMPPLLKEASSVGLKTINGLWMLIYQAIRAEEIWQARKIKGVADKIYRSIARRLRNV